MFKPRLLRETAEIALTEIKRHIEPKMAEEFSLRRVSAPLYLPVTSGLNDPGEAVRFVMPSTGEEVEIVRGLNRWLRTQLIRYDIAPGFGVFTVMNALRPDQAETATTSPHVGAWAWQQVVDPGHAGIDHLAATGKRLYSLMQQAEEMIIERFPHLGITLPQRFVVIEETELAGRNPDASPERREYEYLHDHTNRAILIADTHLRSRIVVWNPVVGCPLTIAETSIDLSRPVGSIGGTIFRDQLAMQILHQPHLLR